MVATSTIEFKTNRSGCRTWHVGRFVFLFVARRYGVSCRRWLALPLSGFRKIGVQKHFSWSISLHFPRFHFRIPAQTLFLRNYVSTSRFYTFFPAVSSANCSTTLAVPSKNSLMPLVKPPAYPFSVLYLPERRRTCR